MPGEALPLVSLILCSRNPRPDLLRWSLDSIDKQTIDRDRFEVIVVDNSSDPPIKAAPGIRLIREPEPGLTIARVAGIKASKSSVIVFADDDNYLAANYLAEALRIASDCPWIGCFGGLARAVFEAPVETWKLCLLGYLGVRDYGPHAITSKLRKWGEWEPIGAGLVTRREVAEQYVAWVTSIPATRHLGRSASCLMSGDDALFAHAAYRLGFACSYQPSLRVGHWMAGRRMRTLTLARTILGHGRSQVILYRLTGQKRPRPAARDLYRRFRERVQAHGSAPRGGMEWLIDLGAFLETRRSATL